MISRIVKTREAEKVNVDGQPYAIRQTIQIIGLTPLYFLLRFFSLVHRIDLRDFFILSITLSLREVIYT